jgi:hypothetical protein
MKYIEKAISILACLAVFALTVITPVTAADSFSYTEEAKMLNSLGLYSGISNTNFNPDLGTALNRETGIVMLLRLIGLENDALKMTDAEADTALSKFKDTKNISSWAKKQLAYAVKTVL